jgi:DNA-directed RNA polymerase specialized sigma24 family protein
MKATIQEYDFHQRILARDDPIAFAALAEWLYHPLVQDVRKRAGINADPVLVEEAVGEALLNYHDAPEKYDPSRISLRSYLIMSAYRDFQNAWIKENRQTKYQISLFDPAFQKSEIAVSQETAELIEHELRVEELWKLIDEIFPDSTERRIVTLILNKVRSPEPYAQALGLSDVSHDDQLRQIRLVKYRITRRLRRRMAQQLYQTGG